jgi:hypothetical protein
MRVDDFDLISANELRQLKGAAEIKRIAQRQFDDSFRRQICQFTLQRRARDERDIDFVAPARQPICQVGQMSLSTAQRTRRRYLQDSHAKVLSTEIERDSVSPSLHNFKIDPLSRHAMLLASQWVVDDDLKDVVARQQISTELNHPTGQQSFQIRCVT